MPRTVAFPIATSLPVWVEWDTLFARVYVGEVQMRVVQPNICLDMVGVDWARAWSEDFDRRISPSDAKAWGERAGNYADRRLGNYERAFIDYLDLAPGETVLDFGCGPGVLAIPLAQRGHRVLACDFSQGMLDELVRRAKDEGVDDLIETRLVAWDDDWVAKGVPVECADVAVASRSITTRDMLGALLKLDAAARRRACVTLAAGHSPRRDERAYEAVGRKRRWVADYAWCMSMLFQHGVYPELSYIMTHSHPAFRDRAEATHELTRMMESDAGPLTEHEKKLLDKFLDEHYAFDENAKPGREFASDTERTLRWACIRWDAGATG